MSQSPGSSAQSATPKLQTVAFTGLFCLIYAQGSHAGLLFPGRRDPVRRAPAGADLGIAMFWFGWVASAMVGAAVLAWLIPKRRLRYTGWLTLSWLAPPPLALYVIVHEWHWFTR